MVNRVTIVLPEELAQAISRSAAEALRSPRQQIVWLLRQALLALPEAAEDRQPGSQSEEVVCH
jgi:hypothetical protein